VVELYCKVTIGYDHSRAGASRISTQPSAVASGAPGRGPGTRLERERCQVGPKYASWPTYSCGNTAIKGEVGPTSEPTWRLSHLDRRARRPGACRRAACGSSARCRASCSCALRKYACPGWKRATHIFVSGKETEFLVEVARANLLQRVAQAVQRSVRGLQRWPQPITIVLQRETRC
jgi:hypothetical protein